MKTSKRKIAIAMAAAMVATAGLAACEPKGTDMLFKGQEQSTSDYYADTAMPAHEYAAYLSKHVAQSSNEVVAVISNLRSYLNGATTADTLATTVSTAREVMSQSLADVEMTRPADGYESLRENYMSTVTSVLAQLDIAETATGSGDTETVSSVVDMLESLGNALTSMGVTTYR